MATPTANDITREKTLFALWRTSFKFKQRAFNTVVALVMGLLLARYCSLVWETPQVMVAFLRRVEPIGLSFATSILGFLVAGFTVFVTVTRIDMFLEMARREKRGTGESYLKYNLSAFIVTFVHYTSYIFACLAMELLLQPGGLASVAFANAKTYPCLADYAAKLLPWLASLGLVLFGTWTIYLVMLLKSFIYNVYQTTTTLVGYEWGKADELAKANASKRMEEEASPVGSSASH